MQTAFQLALIAQLFFRSFTMNIQFQLREEILVRKWREVKVTAPILIKRASLNILTITAWKDHSIMSAQNQTTTPWVILRKIHHKSQMFPNQSLVYLKIRMISWTTTTEGIVAINDVHQKIQILATINFERRIQFLVPRIVYQEGEVHQGYRSLEEQLGMDESRCYKLFWWNYIIRRVLPNQI